MTLKLYTIKLLDDIEIKTIMLFDDIENILLCP